MSGAHKFISGLTTALVLLAGSDASRAADEAPRVALIADPSETVILPRLQAELSGLGLEVRTVDKRENERLPQDLIDAARATGAVAAFRIVVEDARADVWIADRVTGKVVLREMLPRGAQIDGRVVALRAVELLRVSLMELEAPRPPQGEVAPPAALAETRGLLPEPGRFWFAADSAFLWSPGGCGPGIGVAAGVSWRPSWIGPRLSGGSMLAPSTITLAEGTGEVTTSWLALDAVVEPWGRYRAVRPRAGLGVAGLATSLHGIGLAPRSSHQKTVYTVSPVASLEVGWAIHSRLRLGLGVSYLRPLQSVDILVAEVPVGSYGRDIFLGSVGVDLVLP